MKYNPEIHNRQSHRTQGHDYSQSASYFVTICTQNRKPLFGEIKNGKMHHNEAGLMVQKWWYRIPSKFITVQLHEQIVMPNHFHAIIQIRSRGGHIGPPLGEIIGWFKTMTTNEYIRNVKQNGWPRFQIRLWQRDFHERIICDQTAYQQITKYIQNNPSKWH